MNKICPKCGTAYDDPELRFCENDGEILEMHTPPATGISKWKKNAPLILILLGVASLVALMPWFITGKIRDGLKVEIEESKLVDSIQELKLPVKVTNKSSFGFTVDEVIFNLVVLGVQVAKDERHKIDLKVPANGTELVQVPVGAILKNVHIQVQEMQGKYGGTSATMRVNGSFWGLPISVLVDNLDFTSPTVVLKSWLSYKEPERIQQVIEAVTQTPEVKNVTGNGNKAPVKNQKKPGPVDEVTPLNRKDSITLDNAKKKAKEVTDNLNLEGILKTKQGNPQ